MGLDVDGVDRTTDNDHLGRPPRDPLSPRGPHPPPPTVDEEPTKGLAQTLTWRTGNGRETRKRSTAVSPDVVDVVRAGDPKSRRTVGGQV